MRLSAGLAAALWVSIGAGLRGRALFGPAPGRRRLARHLASLPRQGLPLDAPAVIRWNRHAVPFIEAESDHDAAFALGLVHAHLRLGQMEILRRVAQGRVAEMIGPPGIDIDHGLRILDPGAAVPAIAAALAAPTRAWLDAFVAGINHYIAEMRDAPCEFRVLGLSRERWTVADLLAYGRLAGADVTWLVWYGLLELGRRPDWPQVWRRLVADGQASAPSFGPRAGPGLAALLPGIGRPGSNSLAIAGRRTESGGALMASDPHLGLVLPNLWLLAGIRCPSYHVVGLMPPGLPVFAIGRNPRIAWGGTNMRAQSSELVDVSDLSPGEIETRETRIRVRWWLARTVTVRHTAIGPIVSDAPLLRRFGLPPTALRWIGHRPSDEIGAMLEASRARNFAEFRRAFRGFAVPAQNMLYADADGHIGQVMAARLPARPDAPPRAMIRRREEALAGWERLLGVEDLPFAHDPEEGFLASANNRPSAAGPPVGFFFSPDDRVRRMACLVGAKDKMNVNDLKDLQRDVYMESSDRLRHLLLAKLDESRVGARAGGSEKSLIERLRQWDARYEEGSEGAPAFELFRHAFATHFYGPRFGTKDVTAFANLARAKQMMLEDVAGAEPETLRGILGAALADAARRLAAFPDWGAMHRLGLAHPFVSVPLAGRRFRFTDLPVGGSTDTLMKTAHRATGERHFASYGANARHISDLGDPDRNLFVLLGGEDGWFGSPAFLDQLALWRQGRYIEMPLTPARVRALFPTLTELNP